MHRLQHGIILADLTLEIHLLEHVQRRLLSVLVTKTRSSSGLGLLQRARQLPPLLAALEAEGLAIVTRSNDLGLSVPEETHEGQKLRVDADHRLGRLLGRRGVDDGDRGVMRRKGQGVAARAEGNGMHPSGRVVQELAADRVERQSLAPGARLGTLVGALDEGGKDAGVGIGGAGSKKNAVGVPGDGGNGGADRLLQVLGYPPVIFLLKVADGDDAVAGADGELGFRGRPADEGGGAGDAEEHEGGLVAGGGGFPDEGVAVCELGLVVSLAGCDGGIMGAWVAQGGPTLRASHNAPGVGGNVDAGDKLVMSLELVLELEGIADSAVELDLGVAGNSQGLAIGREGVVGDGVVEEMVDLGSSHCELLV